MRKHYIKIMVMFFTLLMSGIDLEAKILKLVTFNYPPLQYQENGKIEGVTIDLMKEIFKRINQPINISLLPFSRALDNIKKGKSDIIFTFYHKKEREKFADYSKEPLVRQIISLFVSAKSGISFNGHLNKLRAYRFGLVNFSYGKIIDNAIKDKVLTHIEYCSDMKLNIKKFFGKRFDILPLDRWVAYYYFEKNKLHGKSTFNIKELTPPVDSFDAYIGLSKINNLNHIRTRVDDVIREMKKDGSYTRIISNHLKKLDINKILISQ